MPEYFTEGKVINDKLVRVELKNGKEQLLLIHIEVQSQYDEDFANRMFTYYYRIVDRYHLPVEALAIFADKNKKFHPKVYQSKAYQTELIYKFRTYKVVLHTEAKLLKQKNNPFAFAVLAAKYLINTDKDLFDERKQYKLKLTRLLFEQKYTKATISNLLLFIDNILALPAKFEDNYREIIIEEYKTQKTMTLTFENSNMAFAIREIARREGREEVREVAFKSSLRSVYNAIIKSYTNQVIIDITGLSEDYINFLRQKVTKTQD